MERVSNRVMNLGHFLAQTAAKYPDAPAMIRGAETRTFAQMDRRVCAVCAALSQRGVGKGDRILVQSRNSFAMFEAMFAAWRLGAVLVPVNFRLTPDEVAYIADNAGVSVLIYDEAFRGHRDAVAAAVTLSVTVCLGAPAAGEADWEGLAAGEGTFPDAAVDRDDPCWFFFTSGTTGHPKAAVLTHGQMGFVIVNYLADLFPDLRHDTDRSLVVAPLSHGAGIHQIAQVARGVGSVFPAGERFDGGEVMGLIERHRITNAFTVPTILKTMAEHPAAAEHDTTSLRHLIYAGSPITRVDQRRALAVFGKSIVQYFGLGEVTGNITVLSAQEHDEDDALHAGGRIGTCGTARAGMQVQIQDDEGRAVAPGETGEICVTGPAVFAGYWNNDEANAKAFRDGWFRTGDLGHMDEAGYLFITGRASDMYISGGSNIYPLEIEEKLATHPDVREVAVVGMPDEKWGEVGVVALVPHDPGTFDVAAFEAWMASVIARYKLPRRVVLFEELPKSGYGKVTKKLVRAAIEGAD